MPSAALLLPLFASIFFFLLLLLFLLFLYLHFSRRRRRSPTLPLSSSSPPPPPSSLRLFSFPSLRSSTLHFHPSRSLGRGSSSSVFLSILPDGTSLAVKRLPHPFFLHELHLSAHLPPSPFILPLLGYCPPQSLLVYEYMCNGSLQDALFSSSPPRPFILHWDLRFRILLDVAQALSFLHLHCDPPVIHGDLKPSNVLLGSDFRAKLADFGLSRRKAHVFSPQQIDPLSLSDGEHEKKKKDDDDDEIECELGGSSPPLDDGRMDWWWKQDDCYDIKLRTSGQIVEEEAQDNKLKAEEAICDRKERKMREWWKEEYFAEISKSGENNKLGDQLDIISLRKCWKKKRRRKRKNQSVSVGSEILNTDIYSKELSSTTTSMRGTVCYVAPEHGGFSPAFEKADIYSYGVLILVVVSGRRPLHVQESPMKLDRANLISWCRQLALVGDVLDILDEKLKDSCNKDQVNLCINLALLCLQRRPDLRPDSGDIVKILKGDMEIPVVPLDSSNSPICRSMRRNKQESG